MVINRQKKYHRKAIFTTLLIAYISHFIYYFGVFNKNYQEVLYLVFIALIALTIGYLIGISYRITYNNKNTVIRKKTLSFNQQKNIAFIFITIGILSHILYYRNHMFSRYAEGYGASRGYGYITVFFNFWLVGMIILEYLSDNDLINKKIKWGNRALMILYIFFYFFILMKRRQIIILFLCILGIWKDKFTKTQKIALYSLGILLIIVFTVFGRVRGVVDSYGILAGFEYSIDNFSLDWIALDSFEGKYISKTLYDVYGYVNQNGYDPSVVLGVVFCMIPRKLLGGMKPLSFPEWYTFHFHYDDYLSGVGYAGSFVGELYLIGGVVLVFIGYFVVGYISARIQKYREHINSSRDTLIYSLYLYTIFILPRYDLSSLLIDAIFMYLPIIWFCNNSRFNYEELKNVN